MVSKETPGAQGKEDWGEKRKKKRRRKYSRHQQKLPYCLLLLSDAELAGNLNIHLVASCHMAVMPFTFLITSSLSHIFLRPADMLASIHTHVSEV